MIKIINLDELFDKSIKDYVYKNMGKVKPEEIENEMPILYEKFGDTKLAELDGCTPNTYYKQFSINELLSCLKVQLESKVPISDYLCEAIIESENASEIIVKQLYEDGDEQYMVYLMNMVEDIGGKIPVNRYLEFIVCDYSQTIREIATEALSRIANSAKEEVLSAYQNAGEEVKVCLVEIMANMEEDDRIFKILIDEFLKNTDKIAQYALYLSRYGDQRAIDVLMECIENENINYADFEELRFAIEALGGEYTKQRDFSRDSLYKKIKQKTDKN